MDSVSEELSMEMVNQIFKDFKIYAMNRYYEKYTTELEEFVTDFPVSQSKAQCLMQNLFWWRLFYESDKNNGTSLIADYIAENQWLSKWPILISSLRECAKVVPKFYFMTYKQNERAFIAMDILTEETLEVNLFDSPSIPLKQGQIAIGTLIPLGGSSFFPITEFYQFDFESRQEIANHLKCYYDQHLHPSPRHEVFIYMLTAMLQMESFLSFEHQHPYLEKINNNEFAQTFF